ncbi:large ribosomal subunit protein uL13m isoform X1 [Saccopteryx leptura]|uniref:large ribosomal subunit protein uL13m isoform X1 n=2 Tax=Saccopteryx leptura TaxID=249018 RepID=UPI00339C0440
MSSFSKAPQQWATFARVWYLLDGKLQPPGKLAAVASIKLQGLHKPVYHQLSDCGDHVVIMNTRHIAFSGNKWEQKVYSSHTGYPGGFKQVTAAQLHQKDPVADPRFFTMGMCSIGAGALGAAALALLLANTDMFLSKSQQATLQYLEEIDLKTLEKEPRTFKAKELWEKTGAVIMAVRRPGCFLCREEAADLASLKPQLDELGVPLYAVVKEQIRTEVRDFQPYFKGEIFLDEKKKFYGPQKRKMMFMGFVRLGVWNNFLRAWNGGFSGNLEGEGFILGGVFVVGPGEQGILLEHREKEFGDKVNPASVLEAAKKIKPQASASEKK